MRANYLAKALATTKEAFTKAFGTRGSARLHAKLERGSGCGPGFRESRCWIFKALKRCLKKAGKITEAQVYCRRARHRVRYPLLLELAKSKDGTGPASSTWLQGACCRRKDQSDSARRGGDRDPVLSVIQKIRAKFVTYESIKRKYASRDRQRAGSGSTGF